MSIIVDIKKLWLLLDAAENMISYLHNSGYPVYDGGHSEPESECKHETCQALRELKTISTRGANWKIE